MSDFPTRRRRHRDLFSPIDDMRRAFRSFMPDFPEWMNERPAVDVKREENEYRVEAELPGMTEKDIDVNVEDNVLTISSEKEESREETEEEGYLVKERRSSSFRRSFTLPEDADKDKIDANFNNGLLTLHIPRTGESKPRKIQVKSNQK